MYIVSIVGFIKLIKSMIMIVVQWISLILSKKYSYDRHFETDDIIVLKSWYCTSFVIVISYICNEISL